MRRFVDSNGGLEIEKHDSIEVEKEEPVVYSVDKPFKISGEKAIETAYSYQLPMFSENKSENGGSQCVACGKKTSYDNRHVCVDCWKKYSNEIFDTMKNQLSKTEISIS